LFEQLFEEIVKQCVEVGLVQGKHLSVDGSFVGANAAKESRIPRGQLTEAAQVNHTVRQYLVELEAQNPVEEPVATLASNSAAVEVARQEQPDRSTREAHALGGTQSLYGPLPTVGTTRHPACGREALRRGGTCAIGRVD
jgi:hypothetical protein